MKTTTKVLITVVELIISVITAFFIVIAVTPSPYHTKEDILGNVGDTVLVDDEGNAVVLTEEMILSQYDVTQDGRYIHHCAGSGIESPALLLAISSLVFIVIKFVPWSRWLCTKPRE